MATETCTLKLQNNSIPRPNLTKIPGELPKSKPDRYVDDLSKLTKVQLLEIKNREEKLLSNKLQISKLPDKGKRIQDFYEKVLKEIEHRDEVEKAAQLFSDLNIASSGKDKLNNMEWNGKYDPNVNIEEIIDSDDEDEIDPLKIIAGRMSKTKVKILKPDKPLITEEDFKEIESFKIENVQIENENYNDNSNNKNDSTNTIVNAEIVDINITDKLSAIKPILENKLLNGNSSSLSSSHNSSTNSLNLDPHVLYLFEKNVDGLPQKEKFKPYKTTKTNIHDPEKEKFRKPLGQHWEITAATPPPIQHSGTQLLPLQDSVEIQTQYLERLKKLQEKQAEERLAARAARKAELSGIIVPDESMLKLNNFFGGYRITAIDDDDDDDSLDENHERGNEQENVILSDDEVRDDEYEKEGGTVTYTVYN